MAQTPIHLNTELGEMKFPNISTYILTIYEERAKKHGKKHEKTVTKKQSVQTVTKTGIVKKLKLHVKNAEVWLPSCNEALQHTVDGQNPAPRGMVKTLQIMG